MSLSRCGVVGAVGDVFVGVLDLTGERRHVEIVPRHRAVGEHRQSGGADLGKTADHHDRLAFAAAEDGDDAGPQRGHQRCVAGQDAHVAFGARQVDLIDVAGEQHPFGRDEFEMKVGHFAIPILWLCYAASAASFLPFSTA